MKQSAGLLLWRQGERGLEVLLVHPSGPYNRKAPWSIPKGEPNEGEAIEICARREVAEETGVVVTGPVAALGHIDYTKSKKRVHAYAAPLPADQVPRCAQWEVDKAEMLGVDDARRVIHQDQAAFIDRLVKLLATPGGPSTMTTTITRDGAVAVLRLDEGRGNALSFETIDVLRAKLAEIEQSDARAVVLTGRGKVFSAGLDLRACWRFDRATMVRYVDAFEALFERVFSFPLPIVAAVNGAAIAGGAVMALACDVRVMAPPATLALNEVMLGIPLPSMAFEVARFGLPATAHVDGIALGKTFDAQDAVARGVADAVGGDDDAVARARDFTERGHGAVVAVKAALRAESLERARTLALSSRRQWVDAFFAADAQTRIRAVVDKLEGR